MSLEVNDAIATSCKRYALQQNLLPSSFDFSIPTSATPLEAAAVKRPLTPNPNPKRAAAFSLKKTQNVLALFIQISGESSRRRCRTCRQGHGLWAECVVTDHPDVDRTTQGACANCYYNGLGSKCSFRENYSVRVRGNRNRNSQPSITLPIQFPPDIVNSIASEGSNLSIKKSLLLSQLHRLDRQIYLCQLRRLGPPDGFEEWLKRVQPEYGFIADLDTDEISATIAELNLEIDNFAKRLSSVLTLVDYYSAPKSIVAIAEGASDRSVDESNVY
ncbi:hypothetical protein F5883DRAFT_577052 [Diaporthe sp. PMI_573]|nr:hypothetical protein F5883DRAFT_577052 [Diaporthaceae sp. PMI_573]